MGGPVDGPIGRADRRHGRRVHVPLRVHQAGEEAAGGVVVFAGLGNEVVVRYVLPAEGGWAVLPDPVAPLGHTQAWAANQWFWVATHEGESTTWTPVRR